MWQLPWPGRATSTLRSRSPGWISLTACSTYMATFFISAVLNSYSGEQATHPIFERVARMAKMARISTLSFRLTKEA